MYYKVVRENLKFLGMKPGGKPLPLVQYFLGKWAFPLEPICDHRDKGGGLWVHPKRYDAFKTVRYIWRNYRRKVKVFLCLAGDILCRPSDYRAKTTKVKLLVEIPTEFLYKGGGNQEKSDTEKLYEEGYEWKRTKVRCDNTISPGCGWEGRRIWGMKMFNKPCPKCGKTRTLFCPPKIVKE